MIHVSSPLGRVVVRSASALLPESCRLQLARFRAFLEPLEMPASVPIFLVLFDIAVEYIKASGDSGETVLGNLDTWDDFE